MSPRFNRAWLSGSHNRFHRCGEPQPMGRKGRKAGIWKVFSLAGRAIGYMVGTGRVSGHPLAMVFGSGLNLYPTLSDYRTARAIAADHRRAERETDRVFDLRRLTTVPSWLLSIVLRPADNKGRAVVGCGWEGSMYEISRYSKSLGGLQMVCWVDGVGEIPWDWTGKKRRPVAAEVPQFEAPIGEAGWAPVPTALKEYLDRIDPLPNKKAAKTTVETLSPGQCESLNAAAVTAA